jgi:hypothetical protein
MKRAVNRACMVRRIEQTRQHADARDQIVDRRGPEVAERGLEGNAAAFGCIPKRSSIIEPSVEQCPVFVQLRLIIIALEYPLRLTA